MKKNLFTYLFLFILLMVFLPFILIQAFAEDDSNLLLTVGVVEIGGNFQPFYYPITEDKDIIDLIFQRPLRRNLDGDWVGDAAKDWEVSNDLKEVTFTLNEDLFFSDGTPLTVKDLHFTYKVLKDPDFMGVHHSYARGLETIEVLNNRQILFRFRESHNDNLARANFYIVPEHYYGEYFETEDTSRLSQLRDVPLGSGPYKLTGLDPGQYVFLERNHLYHREDQFPIEEILFESVNTNTLMPSLLQGDIDLVNGMREVRHLKAAEEFDEISINTFYSNSYSTIIYNHQNGPTIDREVRKALALAMDSQGLVDHYFEGFAKVPRHPFGENSPLQNPDFEAIHREPLQNIDEAIFTLERAGWEVGADGIREKNGVPLEIHVVVANYSDIVSTLTPLWDRDWANALGLRIHYSHGPMDRVIRQVLYDEEQSEKGWNVVYMPLTVDPLSPQSVVDHFHSEHIGTGYGNISRYDNRQIDSLIEKTRSTRDQEMLFDLYKEISLQLEKDWVQSPVYTQKYGDLYNQRLDDFETNAYYRWTDALRYASLLDVDIKPIEYQESSERSWFITIGFLVIIYLLYRWNRRKAY